MSDIKHHGGCACGAVRYQLDGPPIFVNNCHCTLCQRETGTTSIFNAFYETEKLTVLSGDVTTHETLTGSGKAQQVKRCARCGVAVFSHFPRLGAFGVAVRVGTLDTAHAFKPDAVIFSGNKMPWVALPDGVPAFEATYNPADVLPPERMARLKALADKARAAQSA